MQSTEISKRRRATRAGLVLVLAFALLPTIAVAQAQRPQRDAGPVAKTLWWNDPVIVQEIGLSQAQRSKMDAAYAEYEEKAEAARKNRGGQRDFVEALETGQWDRARTLLDTWADVQTNPQYAMGEMKLELLQLLSQKQLDELVKDYPRVVRRQWRPAVSWGARPTESGAKPFHGAIQEQRQRQQGMQGKGGPPPEPAPKD